MYIDSVNGVPVIMNSDVGVAMGKEATDAVWNSFHIIVAGDNNNTIFLALKKSLVVKV